TKEEWTGRALAVIQFFRESDQKPGENAAAFERVVKAARTELPAWTEGGAKRVEEMSDAEAALRWLIDTYDDLMGERAVVSSQDPPLAFPRLAALQRRLEDFEATVGAHKTCLAIQIVKSYIAPHKIEREIDALRIVEALRYYAAGHG